MALSPSARRLLARATTLAAGASVVLMPPLTGAAAPAEPAPPRAEAPPDPALLHRPGVQVRPRPGAPALPDDLSALSWLVADSGSGEVLAAHNAHLGLPPASTMKTLFALTALPHLPRGGTHTVTDAELADVGEGSSLVGLDAGLTYRIPDLWRGVFLSSGNDAVHVLASMNGGWTQTAAQMQARARALGATDTHVVSPDGYDAEGQVSSAYDLAVFGRAGLADPDFARYAALTDAQFPGDTDAEGRPAWTYGIENTNRLLTGEDGVGVYPGIVGVKNGYTSEAGYTLVTAARRDGRTLLVTVMNPQQGGAFAVYEETRALLDWGFAAAGRVEPVGSLLPPPGPQRAGTAAPPAAPPPPASAAGTDTGTAYAWPAGFLTGTGAAAAAWHHLRRRRARPNPPSQTAGPGPTP
ncbi:D-alanyl-D-alanine carboxypeptidase family protein [Streptomyces lavendulae]|uniref:D-alanyl-D-alanine carboxypeptidase family protein n=1 Tax=Streptomyces lavendulae TaxID=1914 RepID=UPI0036B03B8F